MPDLFIDFTDINAYKSSKLQLLEYQFNKEKLQIQQNYNTNIKQLKNVMTNKKKRLLNIHQDTCKTQLLELNNKYVHDKTLILNLDSIPRVLNSKITIRTPKKKALLVGINYENTNNLLNGCINDINSIKELLITKYNYTDIITITDQTNLKPTKQNILIELSKLLDNSEYGDKLVFVFSGHGSFVRDTNNDELDGFDELLIPVDALTNPKKSIKDDELKSIINSKLKQGVSLFSLIDSCFSGTALDLKYNYLNSDFGNTETINQKEIDTQGNIIMISGCNDKQTSADNSFLDLSNNIKYNGALTYNFLQSLKVNNYNISYKVLLNQIRGRLFRGSFTQIPQLSSGKKFDINSKFTL